MQRNRSYRRLQAKRIFNKRKKLLKKIFNSEHFKYKINDIDNEKLISRCDGMLKKKLNYNSMKYDNPNIIKQHKIIIDKIKYEMDELND